MEDTYLVGTVKGTHHLAGTVKVNTSFYLIEELENQKVILKKDDDIKLLTLKKVKNFNGSRALLDFYEINNIDLAKKLNGYQIYVRQDLVPEYEEEISVIGYKVYNKGINIGVVENILETSAHDILEIRSLDNKEIMVPFIDVFVTEIDDDKKIIYTSLIEGMIWK